MRCARVIGPRDDRRRRTAAAREALRGLRIASAAFALAWLLASHAPAAPFAKTFSFVQPDGTKIELWGEGDEFHAVFETLDGYTVAFDPATKAYHFARLSPDGSTLLPSGALVGRANPRLIGLEKHLRLRPEAAKRRAQERFRRWDTAMGVTRRWRERKAARQAAESQARATERALPAPPAFTSTGTKVGLCLLIDFDDDPATIPQAEIASFCNADAYSGYGNNGSVKEYFQDNSNALLTYTNVVTAYIRIPNSLHPKSWYNDTSKDCGEQGRLLINDAIAVMKALPNYESEILPSFAGLTVDGSDQAVACNVFYAGGNGGVWAKGLWPHSWALASPVELSSGGKKVSNYQITDIGASLELGTFCHENGHMLCDFPDIYDYDYDSVGGAGVFCLMNSGGHGANPVQICAYLKRAAGWATTVELDASTLGTGTLDSSGAGFNHFYRFQKPGVATEYFLLENRQRAGRDAGIPAAGIAVWHIDELGDKDNQSTNYNSSHSNYEVSLVQADNLFHFQQNANSGDTNDLYYAGNTAAGYANALTDTTAPAARWWDGSPSAIQFADFSPSGTSMTFVISDTLAVLPAAPLASSGLEGGPFTPSSATYALSNSGASAIAWAASQDQSWCSVSASGGTLAAGDATNVLVSINGAADALPPGFHAATVVFSNATTGVARSRGVHLTVRGIPGDIAVLDSIDPADDLLLPFGQWVPGISRTERITITNTDPVHPLVLSNFSLYGFAEDFEDGLAQNWEEITDVRWSVIDGEYRAQAGATAVWMQSLYAGQTWQDCAARVVMRRTGSSDNAALLLLRASADFDAAAGTGDAYLVTISGNGYFYVARIVGGAFSMLQSWTASSYLNTDATSNIVAASIQGSTLTVAFNGHTAWTGTDSSIPAAGRVGLIGYSGSSTETVHYFDNVVVDTSGALAAPISPAQQWYNAHPLPGGRRESAPVGRVAPAFPGVDSAPAAPAWFASGTFRIENAPACPHTVPAGQSVTFDVVFQASLPAGFHEGILHIASDDPDEPSVEVTLTGEVLSDDLGVAPVGGILSQGTRGGPFAPSSQTYTLTNAGLAELPWTSSHTQSWCSVSPAGGTLPAGGAATVTISLNANAGALLPGTYGDAVVFSNATSGAVASRAVSLTVDPLLIHRFPLDADPGWSVQGQWAFGNPTGRGGTSYGNPDPAGGATGDNVFGVNLGGDYSTTAGGPHYLTAGPFNFGGCTGIALQFQRWLNTDFQPYVYATLQVSTNGTTWSQIWANGGSEVADSSWTKVRYDISGLADNQPNVYVRWGYQIGSGAWPYSGWNVDDVEFLGTPPDSADLSVGLTASPDPVWLGSNLLYTVAVTNLGPWPATLVACTNVLPANAAFSSASSSQGAWSHVGGIVAWSVGSLASGSSAALTLTVTPATAGTLSNTASVAASQTDPAPANNFASLLTTVLADADADGMDDAWETIHSLNPGDPSDAPRDADGDGLSNFEEYLSGTDPRNASSALRITQILPGALVAFPSIAGKTYRIEYSDSLAPGDWHTLAPSIPGTGETLQIPDPDVPATGKRFYRLLLLVP